LRNAVPESAQGFLISAALEYYDSVSIAGNELPKFGGNTLKTSGLNFGSCVIAIALKTSPIARFGVSCAK
jgi:hypothetical protein